MSAAARRAVLAHEFAHLRRHDAAISALAWWVRCLLWFHPLAWLVSRKISELVEMACDAVVMERTGDPAGYSRMLLEFAGRHRAILPGLAIASGSKMDRRIDGVFELSGGNLRRLARPGVLLAVMGLPVICLAAVVGLGEQEPPPVPLAPPVVRLMAPVMIAQQSASHPALTQAVAAPVTAAQAAGRPEFEVASIKLSAGCTPVARGGRGGRGVTPTRSSPVTSSPGRLNIGCQSVLEMIQMAHARVYATLLI